jgi:hypothetical protein
VSNSETASRSCAALNGFREKRLALSHLASVHQPIGVAGDVEHAQVRPGPAQALDHLVAAHHRHVQVGDQQIEARASCQQIDQVGSTGCLQHRIAKIFEDTSFEGPHLRFVVDHQHRRRRSLFALWLHHLSNRTRRRGLRQRYSCVADRSAR